ncbi:MAG: hypothetical protein H3C27_09895 [Opitutaceae bacterium]|nr:hypothetical protein [Opitutaceae bacterium]
MRIIISILCGLMLAGCKTPEPIFGVGGQAPQFADYSRSEVEALRASLAKLSFPVPERTVEKMLPKPVEPLPIAFVDWIPDREGKGRVGGNIVEYWLNRTQVLRVATAYYYKDDETPYSLEEWAEIISAKARDHHFRDVY